MYPFHPHYAQVNIPSCSDPTSHPLPSPSSPKPHSKRPKPKPCPVCQQLQCQCCAYIYPLPPTSSLLTAAKNHEPSVLPPFPPPLHSATSTPAATALCCPPFYPLHTSMNTCGREYSSSMHCDVAKGTGLANERRLIQRALYSTNKPPGSSVHTKDPGCVRWAHEEHMTGRACEHARGVYECERTTGAYKRTGIVGYVRT